MDSSKPSVSITWDTSYLPSSSCPCSKQQRLHESSLFPLRLIVMVSYTNLTH
ncbi:hypothetical protein FGIG_08668 [Fasciola gigantica]|uniref:Uncharacterized protein n=1 Tax=Fasciola gigantica TaxID=46835 RepID=A0A504Y966_FASGI|nr:hypothetical protein FGIG_08668 [Fasciola gigantica]